MILRDCPWIFNVNILWLYAQHNHLYRYLLEGINSIGFNGCVLITLGERGGSVVECRTPEREVRGSKPTAAVLCPWARHFTPRKYWLITQEAMAPSRHDWKIVDGDVKPQHNQPTYYPRYTKYG